MKKVSLLLAVMTVISTPAKAQKITIDYAHDFDFSSVESYQYVDTKESNTSDQLIYDRIKHGIIRELHGGGLMSASSDPDLYVTYHLILEENTVTDTTSSGYDGFHGTWGHWGDPTGSVTTIAPTTTVGVLIIDAYDADEKKMVWRGTGTVTLKEKPEKQTQQIDNILSKLGDKWDKIHAGKGE